jgi:hypothetical protein
MYAPRAPAMAPDAPISGISEEVWVNAWAYAATTPAAR